MTVKRSRIELHEVVFMSNHFHLVLTDPDGVLPDFMRDFNSLLSRGLNALRGSTGTNVEKGYNIVRPTDEAKVVEHAVYTLTNPCNANLVEHAGQWWGVTSFALEYGSTVTFRRPSDGLWKSADAVEKLARDTRSTARSSKGRLRRAGRTSLPETVELTLVRPPVMLELEDAALREHIRAEVRRVESDRFDDRRATGRRAVGMQAVLSQSYTDTPSNGRVMFETTPRVSGKSRWARIEALARCLEFERAHAVARDAIAEVLAQASKLGRFLAARLAVIELPDGAFLLRRRYGGTCCLAR